MLVGSRCITTHCAWTHRGESLASAFASARSTQSRAWSRCPACSTATGGSHARRSRTLLQGRITRWRHLCIYFSSCSCVFAAPPAALLRFSVFIFSMLSACLIVPRTSGGVAGLLTSLEGVGRVPSFLLSQAESRIAEESAASKRSFMVIALVKRELWRSFRH